MAPGTLRLETREQFHAFWANLQPNNFVQRFVFSAIFGIGILWALYADITKANAAVLAQEFALTFPYQLLSPADLVAAHVRGDRAIDDIVVTMRKLGFTAEDAHQIVRNERRPPAVGDVLNLWIRGLASESETDQALRESGFTPTWASKMKAATALIPPVADLVQMAVREAFSPDVAAAFGQYEDFPEAVVPHAEAQGLSREWTSRYWAAHWSLPSATQGFEMLHRRIVGEPELKLLLRALDVMPFWRDKLIQLSFNPLTRVDVRRMHALGVLDEAGVRDAYLDLGYAPDRAAQLTAFTAALNKAKVDPDDVELGGLSRSTVLNFYDDGTITRDRATALLTALGHTPAAAGLLLDSIDFAQQRRERKLATDTILDQVAGDHLTVRDAEEALNRLGLSTREVDRALARMRRQQAAAAKLPTVDQVLKLWAAGVVAEPAVRRALATQGFAREWVDAFVKLGEIQAREGEG
jgi:hypothetical protein